MIQDHLFVEEYTRPLRQRELNRQLELVRLVEETRGNRRGFRERTLLQMSDALISIGQRLRDHYAPVASGESLDSPLECAPGS
jgi:hypothetical protein